jgi:uncharacterized membrane protein
VISGVIFVLLAGLNPWIMLTNRGNSERSGRVWMRVHRTVGYVFIVVFAITVYLGESLHSTWQRATFALRR